jgi:hypothetical protein
MADDLSPTRLHVRQGTTSRDISRAWRDVWLAALLSVTILVAVALALTWWI